MNNQTVRAAAIAAGLSLFATSTFAAPLWEADDRAPATSQASKEGEAKQVSATPLQFVSPTEGRPQIDALVTGSIKPDVPAAVKEAKAAPSTGNAYDRIISKYASQHGVPVSLARAVVRVESNYRPNARGSAGEVGLMQIKPATARMMGYSGSVKGLYDPDTNIRYGMKYLAMAHQLGGGDTCGTILRYNAGHAAKRMNKISAAYCAKVKRHLGG